MTQSTIVDVVAIGTSLDGDFVIFNTRSLGLLDGRIIIHNLLLDKEVVSFSQSGAVATLAFRSGIFQCDINISVTSEFFYCR